MSALMQANTNHTSTTTHHCNIESHHYKPNPLLSQIAYHLSELLYVDREPKHTIHHIKDNKPCIKVVKDITDITKIRTCNIIGSKKNKIRICNNNHNGTRIVNNQKKHIGVAAIFQLLLIYYVIQLQINETCLSNYHHDMHHAVLDKISKVYNCWHQLQFGWLSINVKHHTNYTILVHQTDTIKTLINKISSTIGFEDPSHFYILFQNQCFHVQQSNKMKLKMNDICITHNSSIVIMDVLPGGGRSSKREMDASSDEEQDSQQPPRKKRKINPVTNGNNHQDIQDPLEENHESYRQLMENEYEEKYQSETDVAYTEEDEAKYDLQDNADIEEPFETDDIEDVYLAQSAYLQSQQLDVQCNHNHSYGQPCSCNRNTNVCDDAILLQQTLMEDEELFGTEQSDWLQNIEALDMDSDNGQAIVNDDSLLTSPERTSNVCNDTPSRKKRKYRKRGRRGPKPTKPKKFPKMNKEYNHKMQQREARQTTFQLDSSTWMSKVYANKLKKAPKIPRFKVVGGIDNLRETMSKYKENYIGKMEHECPHCGALLFKSELGDKKTGQWNLCCKNGKIKLNTPLKPPAILHHLFTADDSLAKYFQENILMLNNALAMSSSQIFRKELPHSYGRAPPTFILSGAVYHTVPRLLPECNQAPKQAQIYTWDPEEEFNNRINQGFLGKISSQPKFRQLVEELQELLHEHNWIVKMYKSVFEQYFQGINKLPELKLIVHTKVSDSTNLGHYKTFSKPSENSPVASFVEFGSLTDSVPMHRKLVLTTRAKDENRTLLDCHTLSDALAFPLLYPWGESSYDIDYRNTEGNKITMTQYYRYRLMERKGEWNPFIHGQRLFQKFITATWGKIQQNTMNWYINNQKKCRADSYEAISTARQKNKELKGLGTKLNILPRSYVESPRYFRSKYQNAMAILRRIGSIPDFFITFTANANWREVRETMERHKTTFCCRDDIIARVFRAKLKQFLHDLTKSHVLGL